MNLEILSCPVTDGQVTRVIKKQQRYGQTFLVKYVKWCSKQTTAPLCFHLANGLSLLGIHTPRTIYQYFPMQMYCNMFSMIVGRSGADMKSTTLSFARKVINAIDEDQIAPKPASSEGMIDHLAEFERQTFFFPELGSFFSNATGQMDSIKTHFTDLWDCEPQSRCKAGGERISVENPYVNIMGAISLSYLEEFTKPRDWTGGFLGRFLIMYGNAEKIDPDPTGWERDWLTGDIVTHLKNTMNATRQEGIYHGLDSEGEDSAQQYWNDWYIALQDAQITGRIEGTKTRLPAIVRKIALLLCVDAGLGTHKISGNGHFSCPRDILEEACEIGLLHLQSLNALAQRLCDDGDQRLRRRICFILQNAGGECQLSDLLFEMKIRFEKIRSWLESLLMERTISIAGELPNREHPKSNPLLKLERNNF